LVSIEGKQCLLMEWHCMRVDGTGFREEGGGGFVALVCPTLYS